VDGTEPTQVETYFQRDVSGQLTVNPPAEARAWALSAGLTLAGSGPTSGGAAFVVQPADGSVLFMAPELPSQTALLRASPPAGTQRIDFYVDGTSAGSAPATDPTAIWALVPGTHELQVRAVLADGSTTSASSSFEVR
jgi:hypothetical protein